jgi:hypothetical protein
MTLEMNWRSRLPWTIRVLPVGEALPVEVVLLEVRVPQEEVHLELSLGQDLPLVAQEKLVVAEAVSSAKE